MISAISLAASRCRRRARRPGGSQVDRLREDSAVAAFQPVGRDDVNGPAEQRLKFPRHAYQVEQGAALIEVNEQVNVAVGLSSPRAAEPKRRTLLA